MGEQDAGTEVRRNVQGSEGVEEEREIEMNNETRKRRIEAWAKSQGESAPAKSDTIENENARLRIALADAIRRPMGVIPASAEGLVTADGLRAAEERRLPNCPNCPRCGKPLEETPHGTAGFFWLKCHTCKIAGFGRVKAVALAMITQASGANPAQPESATNPKTI